MALPSQADVPFLIGRLRPNAEWRWKGGAANDPSQVRWDDRRQTEPTEREYEAEQILVEAETVRREAARAVRLSRSDQLTGKAPKDLTASEVKYTLEALLGIVGALDNDGLILPINKWGRGVSDQTELS
jgi:hypothetical protein